jgi:hypothetical protein
MLRLKAQNYEISSKIEPNGKIPILGVMNWIALETHSTGYCNDVAIVYSEPFSVR